MRTSFETHVQEYDSWYDEHSKVFDSELAAINKVLGNLHPEQRSIEIGVGTGRFAQALHITHGLDPSSEMLTIAKKRNIVCTQAVAENLPFKNKSFDLALMITVACFLTKPHQAFSEIYRILKPDGRLVLGMIDRNSELGKTYEKKQPENKFYRYARFLSVEEISEFLHEACLREVTTVQTLFRPLGMIENAEPVKYGYGEGGFIAISAIKEKHDS